MAVSYYEKLLKRDPDNLDLKLSLCYITAMNSDVKQASHLYEKLYQEYPDNDAVLVNYINVELYFENVQRAEELLKALKEKFSDNANIKTFESKIQQINEKNDTELQAEDST